MDDGHYGFKLEKAAAGTDGAFALKYSEVLKEDEEAVPPALRPGGEPPERTAIPFDRYYDPRYVDLEVEHIWNKMW